MLTFFQVHREILRISFKSVKPKAVTLLDKKKGGGWMLIYTEYFGMDADFKQRGYICPGVYGS